ncbi:hypothetical protein SAMN05192552_103112 [Natrinema hispanicum]|uniref:Uncharacterized protein n=1 Tax=Natrinema hispanicum TaxID=392421 RepID=A0A1G6VTD6_9EURY|nr:hypothetical protein SAMN05192552_103112 [Natrinema hispanicum]
MPRGSINATLPNHDRNASPTKYRELIVEQDRPHPSVRPKCVSGHSLGTHSARPKDSRKTSGLIMEDINSKTTNSTGNRIVTQ